MNALRRWLLAVVILAASAAGQAAELPDGTLLFSENCSSVVERTTHGEIAHVALVFQDGGERWVVEATPAKVRRVKLDDYLAELARLNQRRKGRDEIGVLALSPSPEYTSDEITKMRAFVNNQLGRRYSVKNYIRGKPYDGIHCAELTASTLNQSDRYAFAECHKLHPQSLYDRLAPSHTAQRLTIPPLESPEPWLTRWQRRSTAWLTWCRWSCREAWLFLW